MYLPKQVTIIEVGPRDGLQNEDKIVETDVKVAFIKALKQAGIQEMELTSFVSPKWVPQMKDAEEVATKCLKDGGKNFILTPNKKGVERLYQTDCKNAVVFVGVSSTFNIKNINKSTSESMKELKPLIAELKEKGYFVRAGISTAFYCPYEGKTDSEDTINLCKEFTNYGVDELIVADTIGMANPKDVYYLFQRLQKEIPKNILISGHFHDTRGMALANILAALQAGIDRFDSSAGGLGGCPFAVGASGNVATEDVVYMLHEMGIDTGINLLKLKQAIDVVKPQISRELDSENYKLL
ncbi:hydroxymethylglutaryl-CoA lyase [Lentibacillus sp. N15]|uniref:hydroxymethylglutaryl-CoA lyase n=1 Tax=Lentibacillus songyuanensis TaxID=3136161 RepID=UPI0031BB3228